MPAEVEYYFTVVSPFSYLGHQRLKAIFDRRGAAVRLKPIDLGQVFPASGGLPVSKRAPQRQAYRLVELQRWSAFLGIPLNMEPAHFPTPDAVANQMVIAADRAGLDAWGLCLALMRAVWAQDRDVADPETLAEVAREVGIDPGAVLSAEAQEPAATARETYTREAIDRQVFGTPTYIVGDELFWGQDRLDFVERTLAAI